MAEFDDGPLTGAPLNFPKAKPPCCAPNAVFYEPGIGIPGALSPVLPGSSKHVAYGDPDCISGILTPKAFLIDGIPVSDAISLTAVVQPITGFIEVEIDSVADNAGGTWLITVQNECGCCSWLGTFTVTLP